jgi:hypothetical protein
MGRNNTPTAILDARGSFIHNPQLRRKAEPSPRGPLCTAAPKDFTKEQKAVWRELMKMLPPGVAFNSDYWALRHLVLLEAKSRSGEKFMASEHTQLVGLLDRFGLNPSARCRVQVEAPKESRLAQFLKYTPASPPPRHIN